VSLDHVSLGSSYGVLNLAGYSDATRQWVAFVDSTGSVGSTIIIHDALAAADLRSIDVPTWEVQLTFLPREPTLIYSNGGSMFRVREDAAAEQLPFEAVDWFELSEDGTLLAVWDQAQLGIYAYPALSEQALLDVVVPVAQQQRRIGISRDNRFVAISGGYANALIQVFDLANGTNRRMTATGATATYSPTFSRDGLELYVGGGYSDGRVYVFDPTTGTEIRRFAPFSSYLYTIDRVPGFDQLLVGGYDGQLQIVSAEDGTVLWTSDVGHINRAAWSPDGTFMYSGHGAGGESRLLVHRVN
jgi:Tol biopolymer transport system component